MAALDVLRIHRDQIEEFAIDELRARRADGLIIKSIELTEWRKR
jgi:hypothetical protein